MPRHIHHFFNCICYHSIEHKITPLTLDNHLLDNQLIQIIQCVSGPTRNLVTLKCKCNITFHPQNKWSFNLILQWCLPLCLKINKTGIVVAKYILLVIVWNKHRYSFAVRINQWFSTLRWWGRKQLYAQIFTYWKCIHHQSPLYVSTSNLKRGILLCLDNTTTYQFL